MLVSAWKAILFIPGALVVFVWCRRLYGVKSAWLALIAMLVEPTIAAHVSVGALDSMALEAEIIACYLAWRSFESPHPARLVATCAMMAAAISIKLTAVFVLPVWVGFAIAHRCARNSGLRGRRSRLR